MRKTIAIFIILIIAATAAYFIGLKKQPSDTVIVKDVTEAPASAPLCYYYAKQQSTKFSDRAWLKMNITGNSVKGEFHNIPAEKDSKVGAFLGTVGFVDEATMSRTASTIWTSMAEGMQNKEELNIVFGDAGAFALFGEMVDRGDGTYVYKDKTKLTPGFIMPQINCNQMDVLLAA